MWDDHEGLGNHQSTRLAITGITKSAIFDDKLLPGAVTRWENSVRISSKVCHVEAKIADSVVFCMEAPSGVRRPRQHMCGSCSSRAREENIDKVNAPQEVFEKYSSREIAERALFTSKPCSHLTRWLRSMQII